ncbi:aldo/keto reductase [Arthrobacter sp. I2-34]|uniref:Aldo/keto reductase n=1 Tax=Arthrobacter hankyongi TaxID=2904801 RepID=A0ABS9L6L3_9MICC|nr:aldo/keto reductase [Arthrobacter hankyongi]MCG2622132.1 aldo/keto reductase [Arthrobacter hankyongi]
MEHKRLGTSGLKVPVLSLGTMAWGEETNEENAGQMLRKYLDAGGSLIDTAALYADGNSEAIVGSFLGEMVPRQELTLVSKAGVGVRKGEREVDASRGAMLRSLDASLARLGTDYLDLWLVHTWDAQVPLEETLSALEFAVTSGRTRYVGVSNYAGWQLARAACLSRVPLVAIQSEYSLVRRTAEREVIPAAAALGTGVMAWSPLGRGVLTGKYRGGIPADSRGASELRADSIAPYLEPRPSRIVDALATAARGLDGEPLDLALSWALQQPGIDTAVIGPRTPAQLEQILKSVPRRMPAEIVSALNDISAPPA